MYLSHYLITQEQTLITWTTHLRLHVIYPVDSKIKAVSILTPSGENGNVQLTLQTVLRSRDGFNRCRHIKSTVGMTVDHYTTEPAFTETCCATL